MKKNYQQIPLTEYINSAEPLLNYPIQRIGAIPFTSIQDISKTKDFKNATTAQLRLLKEIDSFWYKMMYWIAFYRIGNLDRRLEPLSLKGFRDVEIFGELYATQLELTIQLHRFAASLTPSQFTSPLQWWTNQMLEIKQDRYYSVFHPICTTKTQAVSKLSKSMQFMKGKVNYHESLECMSSLTQDLIVKSLQFSTRAGNQDFNDKFAQFKKIYKKCLDFIKGGCNTKKGFHLAIAKGDFIYLSNQNSRRKIAIHK